MRTQPPTSMPRAAQPQPQAGLLRVVHQVPQRVRLRPHAGRWTHAQCERISAALRRSAGVQSHRISASGHSLTVHHTAPLHAVLDRLQSAVAPPTAMPARAPGATGKRKRPDHASAARRLLVCAVATLAIALLPEPAAPAMLVLRVLICGITAAVRHHAEARVEPCRLTRLLDMLAFLVGLARAESLMRALLKHCAEWLLQRWTQARLRDAFAPAPSRTD